MLDVLNEMVQLVIVIEEISTIKVHTATSNIGGVLTYYLKYFYKNVRRISDDHRNIQLNKGWEICVLNRLICVDFDPYRYADHCKLFDAYLEALLDIHFGRQFSSLVVEDNFIVSVCGDKLYFGRNALLEFYMLRSKILSSGCSMRCSISSIGSVDNILLDCFCFILANYDTFIKGIRFLSGRIEDVNTALVNMEPFIRDEGLVRKNIKSKYLD